VQRGHPPSNSANCLRRGRGSMRPGRVGRSWPRPHRPCGVNGTHPPQLAQDLHEFLLPYPQRRRASPVRQPVNSGRPDRSRPSTRVSATDLIEVLDVTQCCWLESACASATRCAAAWSPAHGRPFVEPVFWRWCEPAEGSAHDARVHFRRLNVCKQPLPWPWSAGREGQSNHKGRGAPRRGNEVATGPNRSVWSFQSA